MSRADDDRIVRALTARGVRAVHHDEWTPQLALDVIRETRARYATNPRVQALARVGTRLATELQTDTGLPAADIALVLLATSGKLSSLAYGQDLDPLALAEIMNCAADDLDRRAQQAGGETP